MTKETVTLTINGQEITVSKGTTILAAARSLNIEIPTLCHLNMVGLGIVNNEGCCRVCVVEEVGWDKMLPACTTKCKEGMEIRTDSFKAINARRLMVELLISNHPSDCLICSKSGHCDLQDLAHDLGVRNIQYPGERLELNVDESSYSIRRDMNKCILCKRCENVCKEVQTVDTLTAIGRGFPTVMGTSFDAPIHNTNCTFCGQCLAVCPTGALTEISQVNQVYQALNSDKTVIVQTAPAVRVALGELFDMAPGENVTGQMVTALRKLGFSKVFDTNFAADVTIMEEASEFARRLSDPGAPMPMLTSCCPAWIKFFEHNYNDLLDIPSSCKSPHEMFGSLSKSYLAEKMNIDPKDMVVVSVMPCVAKKWESARPELSSTAGVTDVDYVITTKELGEMIKFVGIDFANLEEGQFDSLMGESSGAGDIFGVTGGVLEAALRTANYLLTGEDLTEDQIVFKELRGLHRIKEAEVEIAGKKLKVASASGLGNARILLDRIRNGENEYQLIEIMACPGGCIDGAGQPAHNGDMNKIMKRMQAIYKLDETNAVRYSHRNPMVQKLYEEYLGEPLGERSEQLLHTAYKLRPKYEVPNNGEKVQK